MAAALRTMLQRVGFTNNAATTIVDTQGMDSLDEFRLLKDDEVEDLCKVVRRPGGMIANPDATAAGQPPNIPNPGIPVSLKATNNLKLVCYYLRYKARSSRVVTAAEIDAVTVRRYRDHKDWEEDHEDPDAPELTFKDWPKTIDAIREFLRECLGTTKIPLAYVIRESQVVPDSASDPPETYSTKQDELIARAPIFTLDAAGNATDKYTDAYLADRAIVWDKLSSLTRDKECWTYVRPGQRPRDGRLAFQGLEGHYLGVNNADNMASKAEKKLQMTSYNGETRKWNFERYVRTHVEQHHILEGLVRHGHVGIDERSKVRHLLSGIKTNKLDHVKAQILSAANLRNSFDSCVNLFQDFIAQSSAATTRDFQIAKVEVKRNGKGKDSQHISNNEYQRVKPDMSVEDRYYKESEYKKLPVAQKKALALKRAARGDHNPKKKKQKIDGVTSREVKAIVKAALKKGKDEGDIVDTDSSSDEDEVIAMKSPANTNRDNKALQRKK